MNLLNLLFNFSGRINRAKFWLAVLICIVVVRARRRRMVGDALDGRVFGVALIAHTSCR